MSERVSVSMHDGVADVRLNRPDKLNALDAAMFEALAETGRELSEDRSLRAVVLSGEGRGFCAGLDFEIFRSLGSDKADGGGLFGGRNGGPANRAQTPAYTWTAMPVPVIAAVHGVAYGGGLQIALGADIRIVAPDASLSVMEVRWGLIPDMTGTQTLRHLVRQDVAKELTYTGRIVSGREAVELGLATKTSEDPHRDAMNLAEEIAGKSPDAIRAAKRLLNDAPLVDLATGLKAEAKEQVALIGGKNQTEAMLANMEKRAPEFSDPE